MKLASAVVAAVISLSLSCARPSAALEADHLRHGGGFRGGGGLSLNHPPVALDEDDPIPVGPPPPDELADEREGAGEGYGGVEATPPAEADGDPSWPTSIADGSSKPATALGSSDDGVTADYDRLLRTTTCTKPKLCYSRYIACKKGCKSCEARCRSQMRKCCGVATNTNPTKKTTKTKPTKKNPTKKTTTKRSKRVQQCIDRSTGQKNGCIRKVNGNKRLSALGKKQKRRKCNNSHELRVRQCNNRIESCKTDVKRCWDGTRTYTVPRDRANGCKFPECECDPGLDEYLNGLRRVRKKRDPSRGCNFPDRECASDTMEVDDGTTIRTLVRQLNDGCSFPEWSCADDEDSCWNGLEKIPLKREKALGCNFPACACDIQPRECAVNDVDPPVEQFRSIALGCGFPECTCDADTSPFWNGLNWIALDRAPELSCGFREGTCSKDTERCWDGREYVDPPLTRLEDANCTFPTCTCASDTKECFNGLRLYNVTRGSSAESNCRFPDCECDPGTETYWNGVRDVIKSRLPDQDCTFPPSECDAEPDYNFWDGLKYVPRLRDLDLDCDFTEGVCSDDYDMCWNGTGYVKLERDVANNCTMAECTCAMDTQLCFDGVNTRNLTRILEDGCKFPACTCDDEPYKFWDGLVFKELSRNPDDNCNFEPGMCAQDSKECFDGQNETSVKRVLLEVEPPVPQEQCHFEQCPPCLPDKKKCWTNETDYQEVGRDPDNYCRFDACPQCDSTKLECWNGDMVSRNFDKGCIFDSCPTCEGEIKVCFDGENDHVLEMDTENCGEFTEECPPCIQDPQWCWNSVNSEPIPQVRVYDDTGTKCEFPDCDSGQLCFTGTSEEVTAACAADDPAAGKCCSSSNPQKPACSWEGTSTVCSGSCRGESACLTTGAAPPLKVGPDSCHGTESCAIDCVRFSSWCPSSEEISIGENSCKNADLACALVESVGSESCLGAEACFRAGVVGSSSCTNSYSCNLATSVGDDTSSCDEGKECP